jgi:hypothetical protein
MPYGIVFMTEVLPTLIWTAGGLAALWLGTNTFLKYRRNPSGDELGRIAESLELLHHSVEDIRDEMRDQMSEVRELSGRIEFAERILAKGPEEE